MTGYRLWPTRRMQNSRSDSVVKAGVLYAVYVKRVVSGEVLAVAVPGCRTANTGTGIVG